MKKESSKWERILANCTSIFITVTDAVRKPHCKATWGGVYLVFASTPLFIIEGSQDRESNSVGTWKQELMLRPWRSSAYWLAAMSMLTCLPCYPHYHQPGVAQLTIR